jgi:hypothetical protein
MYVVEPVWLHVTQSCLVHVHEVVAPPAQFPTPELHVKEVEATDERSTVEDVEVHVLSNKAAKSSQSARELV